MKVNKFNTSTPHEWQIETTHESSSTQKHGSTQQMSRVEMSSRTLYCDSSTSRRLVATSRSTQKQRLIHVFTLPVCYGTVLFRAHASE